MLSPGNSASGRRRCGDVGANAFRNLVPHPTEWRKPFLLSCPSWDRSSPSFLPSRPAQHQTSNSSPIKNSVLTPSAAVTRKTFNMTGFPSATGLKRLMHPICQEVESLLLRGECIGNPRLVGICQELYDHREWLWTSLDVEGVEPINNVSERALRHAVIWRKLSFCTQSERGSRFVETIFSVVETCRQQSRSVFDFFGEAVQAHFANQPAPSLFARSCTINNERAAAALG